MPPRPCGRWGWANRPRLTPLRFTLQEPMSTSRQNFNTKVIDEFHANEGRVGGPFEGLSILLLHHTGAKSGERRINPLAYRRDDGRYVIFASKGGSPTHPAWYHNLKAHPETTIEV